MCRKLLQKISMKCLSLPKCEVPPEQRKPTFGGPSKCSQNAGPVGLVVQALGLSLFKPSAMLFGSILLHRDVGVRHKCCSNAESRTLSSSDMGLKAQRRVSSYSAMVKLYQSQQPYTVVFVGPP